MKLLTFLLFTLASSLCLSGEPHGQLAFANVNYLETAAWKANTAPDARIVYGNDSAPQFADLRLPSNAMPPNGYPVIVFIHGGAWRSEWSKNYTEAFVEALTLHGFATWDLEFRRLGQRDGGYPGTFEDIADGADHLRVVAQSYPLDMDQVIAVGHSSGGHLALWLAGRHRLSESSTLYRAEPLALRGVISIAGVNDLELSYSLGDRKDVLTLIGVDTLDGGVHRFQETNPARLLPFDVPQTLMIGNQDSQWRLEMTQRYSENATAAGDTTQIVIVPGANHMDVVDARSGFARNVAQEAQHILHP